MYFMFWPAAILILALVCLNEWKETCLSRALFNAGLKYLLTTLSWQTGLPFLAQKIRSKLFCEEIIFHFFSSCASCSGISTFRKEDLDLGVWNSPLHRDWLTFIWRLFQSMSDHLNAHSSPALKPVKTLVRKASRYLRFILAKSFSISGGLRISILAMADLGLLTCSEGSALMHSICRPCLKISLIRPTSLETVLAETVFILSAMYLWI